MRKQILLLFLCAFGFNVIAQNSLLWKISGNGLESSSYLFGTIHAICEDDMVMNKSIEEAFEGSNTLYLEIDMTDPQVMQVIQKGMINEGMKNIKVDLMEKDQLLVDDFLKANMGAGLDQLGILKPWAISAMLAIKLGVDCPVPQQYEMIFTNLAKAKQKTVKGLEQVEDQLSLFNNISYEEQLDWVVDGVKEAEEGKALFARLIETYKKQDIEALYHLILQEEEMKKFSEELLDNRNKRWIPVIEKAIGEGSCFIAVGAGHLAGEKGVISLLKQQGYKLEAVTQ
ncbi:TraB/GumN family protein [Marinilabiliaceae bacterium JC017]|nr:TraB/GumN family protein [Marinilabiliaceae bacterium JC017]